MDEVDGLVQAWCKEKTVEEVMERPEEIPGALFATAHF